MKTRDNQGSRDDQNIQSQMSDQSAGERVAEEETEYQRAHQDTLGGTPQMGGSRAETTLAGRAPEQPQSRQNMVDDEVNIEGEAEPEFQNAGGGQPRQRANQQPIGVRGREDSSIRGRESGPVRGEDAQIPDEEQGITNHSVREENQRQEKVAPERPESKPPRSSEKRRAS